MTATLNPTVYKCELRASWTGPKYITLISQMSMTVLDEVLGL